MTLKLCAMLMSVVLLPIGSVEASAAPAAVRNGATIKCGAGRRAVIRRAVVNGQTVDRVQCVRASAVTVRRHGRSWKKSAAVIGGSTAAGAGVGALVGGGKGAAIGAAAGAGAGTAYEVHKRHKRQR